MSKTVLIILDLQNGIISHVPAIEAHLPHYVETIAAARSASIPVIYVTTKFRPNHPEISSRNKMTARIGTMGTFVEGDESVAIHSAVTPAEGDILVTKRRVSAFSGSDLEVILRGLGVENLALAGISTSGAVLSTVRQAADLDYGITVLRDLCFDVHEDVQNILMEKVFVRQADVKTAEEWLAGLKAE